MHTTYNVETGEILGYMDFSNDHIDNAMTVGYFAGYGIVGGGGIVDRDTHYFNIATEEITPRPIITASINKTILSANVIDSIEISTLPIPCTITIDSETYEVTDGVFEFTVDTPGTYIIKATCFPYQPKEWEVTAE